MLQEGKAHYSPAAKRCPGPASPQFDQILAWLFGGHVDGGAGRPRSRRVVRSHRDVIRGAAFQALDDSGRLITHSPVHIGCVFPSASAPVPQLKKGNQAEPQASTRKTRPTPARGFR